MTATHTTASTALFHNSGQLDPFGENAQSSLRSLSVPMTDNSFGNTFANTFGNTFGRTIGLMLFLFGMLGIFALPQQSWANNVSQNANISRDTLYQISTIDALLDGQYDPSATCADLMRNGDTGLGTFADLDGEMVMEGGTVYKVRADGSIDAMPAEEGTPFAAVTWFDADSTMSIDADSIESLKTLVQAQLTAPNHFYAIRITGTFSHVTTRSVPAQHKPYPKLVDVVKHQSVFTRDNVEGTVIGLYSPQLAKSLNVPGFHFHFLSKDKTFGGHILKMSGSGLQLQLDDTAAFSVLLPDSEAFHTMDNSTTDADAALDTVEKGGKE